MPNKTWKDRERQVAAYFHTERTPLSGGDGKQTRSDTLSPIVYVEHKHRQRHAVVTLWDEVKQRAAKEGKVPVITLSEHGRPGFWLVVHCDDAEDVLGQVLG